MLLSSHGVLTTHTTFSWITPRMGFRPLSVRSACCSPRRADVLSDSRTRPSRSEECTDSFLIYVHLIYLRSNQKKTLISTLLGLLKEYSAEMLVELYL